MEKIKLFKIEKAIITAFILTAVISFTGFAKTCDEISDSVLRLHIIANSDSDFDQSLKLQVRDALLEKGNEIFDGSVTRDEAKAKIEPNIAELEAEAERVVRENGFDYPVKITVSEEYFGTREYEDVTLPAGKYMAVRAVIGEGKGRNWWCVMFPPLCLPAAQNGGESDISCVLDEGQLRLVESNPRYEPRFKLVEIYQKILERLDSRQDGI